MQGKSQTEKRNASISYFKLKIINIIITDTTQTKRRKIKTLEIILQKKISKNMKISIKKHVNKIKNINNKIYTNKNTTSSNTTAKKWIKNLSIPKYRRNTCTGIKFRISHHQSKTNNHFRINNTYRKHIKNCNKNK